MENFRKKSDTLIQHGIYYLLKHDRDTGQARNGNPVVVLSKPVWNGYGNFVQVVNLSTRTLTKDPVYVPVLSSGRPSFALCNQVSKMEVTKLGDFIAVLTQEEIENIKIGIAYHFDMVLQSMPQLSAEDAANARIADMQAKVNALYKELVTQTTATSTYHALYNQLLHYVLNAKGDFSDFEIPPAPSIDLPFDVENL